MHEEPTQARFSSVTRSMKVQRVEVVTADVDHNYNRVELSIDGVEFEFSGPDAQVVGAQLNTAGGGDMYVETGAEDTIRRAYRALSNIDTGAAVSPRVATGTSADWINEAREILRAAVESYGR